MAIYSDQSWLAFFKSGSDKWIHINTPKLGFRDLMYSNGRFCAHTLQGRVVVCNLEDGDHPRITEITPPLRVYPTPRPMWTLKGDDNRPYLAESSTGELLQVWRMLIYHGEICQHKNFPPRSTVSVKVFKIDEKVQGGGRVEVRSLGSDTILFIGTSNSISVSVKHFPNLKGNRIFFEDDHHGPLKEEEHDFVVYDLDDGSIKPFLRAGLTHSYFSLPIWILPNPH